MGVNLKGFSAVQKLIFIAVAIVLLLVIGNLLMQFQSTGGSLVDKILECFNNLARCASGQQQQTKAPEAVQ